jgi:hypothetical protein
MKRLWMYFLLVVVALLTSAHLVNAQVIIIPGPPGPDGPLEFEAQLAGDFEVPANATFGSGTLRLTADEGQIKYELTFIGLEGTITQAHIHLGQPGVNGGVIAFLCSNQPGPLQGVQPCPAATSSTEPLTITGVINPNNVIGPAAQGIDPGQYTKVFNLLQRGLIYVNIHTTKFPNGEIRGQLLQVSSDSCDCEEFPGSSMD